MSESLKPLLDLQEIDHARDRLVERKQRLPEKAELADLERRTSEVRAAVSRVETEVDQLLKDVSHREGELGLLDEKLAKEQSKLYSGEVSNPKELSALQSEIEMLKRRKSPMEEAILERLVTRDELYEERRRLEAEIADLDAEAADLRSRIDRSIAEIDGLLAHEDAKRQATLPHIPPDVLELYESLREQKRGIGVGALSDGSCTACREALPAMEVDRIKHAARSGETVFRCVHCRRILVVP